MSISEEQKKKLKELEDIKSPELKINRILADKSIAEAVLKMEVLRGVKGEDGYTPIKGTDYFTDSEISSFVDYIQSQVKDGESIVGEKGDKGDKGDVGKEATVDYEKIVRDVLSKIPKPADPENIDVEDIIGKVKEKIPQVNYKEEIGKILNTPGFRMLLHGGGLSTVAVDGVTITGDGTPGNPLVASASGHTIQDEFGSLTKRTKLNFVGAGVTATDDAGNDATIVTIPLIDISGKVDKVAGSRLITTAEGTILGNTSNTNSGDNAANSNYTNATLAASVITDHAIVRGEGGAKGVQTSLVTIDDNGNIVSLGYKFEVRPASGIAEIIANSSVGNLSIFRMNVNDNDEWHFEAKDDYWRVVESGVDYWLYAHKGGNIEIVKNLSIGNGSSPTARLHLPAGTATAGTAPLKFTSGVVNTTPEAGAIEFDGTDLFFTI